MDDYLKRKEQAVVKDLESAFAGYQRLIVQVNSIRTWTVSIMAASVGFLLTRTTDELAVLVTATGALVAFLLLELRVRSSMAFNKENVLAIQRIFMLEDQQQYAAEVRAYEFRDLRLARVSRADKVRHLLRSVLSWQIALWYTFWLLALGLSYFFANYVIVPRGH